MKSTMATEVVLDALLMAVWRKHPKHRIVFSFKSMGNPPIFNAGDK